MAVLVVGSMNVVFANAEVTVVYKMVYKERCLHVV